MRQSSWFPIAPCGDEMMLDMIQRLEVAFAIGNAHDMVRYLRVSTLMQPCQNPMMEPH